MNEIKKAIIIGGSNGIGLGISLNLLERGYQTVILDICEPDKAIVRGKGNCTFYHYNLLDPDEEILEMLSNDSQVDFLMITAGVGRVADFEYLHPAEIEKVIKIDALQPLKIIRTFYSRIKNQRTFYCGIMGSIAGLVSSPMFSVYAAAKAGVCRFVESVNIELEMAGTKNRILNVSPGSINGTRFNGGQETDLGSIELLAAQIVDHVLASDVLFIPKYEEIFHSVILRYQADAHEYGIHSYQYKLQSGREQNKCVAKIGYLSGTFDLFHVGHLNLLRRAKSACDYLIVGVHPNAAHKGKEAFIPFEQRMEIVAACKYVDKVVPSCPEDSDAWNLWHYNLLFVGSDYKGTERFKRYEEELKEKNVKIVYFPYTEEVSSTRIRQKIQNSNQE